MPPTCETCVVVREAELLTMSPLEARLHTFIDKVVDVANLAIYRLAQLWYGR